MRGDTLTLCYTRLPSPHSLTRRQSYAFFFSMYMLVAFFWMSLRQKRGLLREKVVWGRARQGHADVITVLPRGGFVLRIEIRHRKAN